MTQEPSIDPNLSPKEKLIQFMAWADTHVSDPKKREKAIDRFVAEISTPDRFTPGKWGVCPLCKRPDHPGVIPRINPKGFVGFTNPDLSIRPAPSHVAPCRVWIKKFCKHSTTINRKNCSSFLKNSIESWQATITKKEQPIANGAVILAFIQEGYLLEVHGLNACFFFDYVGPKVRSPNEGSRPRIPRPVGFKM